MAEEFVAMALLLVCWIVSEPITCWLERLPDRLRRWRQTWRR